MLNRNDRNYDARSNTHKLYTRMLNDDDIIHDLWRSMSQNWVKFADVTMKIYLFIFPRRKHFSRKRKKKCLEKQQVKSFIGYYWWSWIKAPISNRSEAFVNLAIRISFFSFCLYYFVIVLDATSVFIFFKRVFELRAWKNRLKDSNTFLFRSFSVHFKLKCISVMNMQICTNVVPLIW